MLKKICICTLAAIPLCAQPIQAQSACDPTIACEDTTSSTTKEGFKELSMDQALSFFKEKKSGILFFGFESCPWCKEARPILKQAAKSTDVDIYYVKVRDDNHNLLYNDRQRKQLSKYIGAYMSKNKNEGNKLWLYVPLVIRIQDGKAAAGHEGTVKGHDATKRKMTAKEKKKLKQIYLSLLKKSS